MCCLPKQVLEHLLALHSCRRITALLTIVSEDVKCPLGDPQIFGLRAGDSDVSTFIWEIKSQSKNVFASYLAQQRMPNVDLPEQKRYKACRLVPAVRGLYSFLSYGRNHAFLWKSFMILWPTQSKIMKLLTVNYDSALASKHLCKHLPTARLQTVSIAKAPTVWLSPDVEGLIWQLQVYHLGYD